MSMALLLVACPIAVRAQEVESKTQARAHSRAASAFFDAHDYARAIEEYEEAYRLWSVPEILFNLGQAARLQGDLQAAATYYRRYLAERPEGRLSDEARKHLAEVDSLLASVAPSPPEPEASPQAAAATPADTTPLSQTAIAQPALPPSSFAPTTLLTTPPHAVSRRTPVYKTWWFWTATLGAAALAGVAVGVGVGIGGQRTNGTVFSPAPFP
jgi:tetratricopeptide (TPR) repeat protein